MFYRTLGLALLFTLSAVARTPNNPDVKIDETAARSVLVRWVADGIDTEGFLLEVRKGDYPDDYCQNGRDVGNTREFRLRRLQPSTSYGVRVCAYSRNGEVSQGSRILFRTNSDNHGGIDIDVIGLDLPKNPDVFAEHVGAREVELRLVPADEGIPTAGFLVSIRKGDYPEDGCLTGREIRVSNFHRLTRLQPNTTYGIRVCPLSENGDANSGSRLLIRTRSE